MRIFESINFKKSLVYCSSRIYPLYFILEIKDITLCGINVYNYPIKFFSDEALEDDYVDSNKHDLACLLLYRTLEGVE